MLVCGASLFRGKRGVDGVPALGWTGGRAGVLLVGLCQVAPSIPANSDLPWLHNADSGRLMREEQRWKVEVREGTVQTKCLQDLGDRKATQASCGALSLGSSQGHRPWAVGAVVPLILGPKLGASEALGGLAFIRGWLMARKIGQGRC